MSLQPRRRTGRSAAVAALTLAGSATGLFAWSRLGVDHRMPLPPALPGHRETIATRRAGDLSFYASTDAEGVPLLLIHSINAAANAYEVRPLYLHFRTTRPVYALDLPGFGFSERSRRRYTPRLMVEAIHAIVAEIRHRHGGIPVDAMALSLSASFLARASLERSDAYRSLALISPTGFDGRLSGDGPPDGHRGRDWVLNLLDRPPFGRPLFDALVTRPSMRFFLQKTFGSKEIDESLLDYDHASAHQPGAEHAPFCFVSGHLFPTDTTRLYERLRLPVWMVTASAATSSIIGTRRASLVVRTGGSTLCRPGRFRISSGLAPSRPPTRRSSRASRAVRQIAQRDPARRHTTVRVTFTGPVGARGRIRCSPAVDPPQHHP